VGSGVAGGVTTGAGVTIGAGVTVGGVDGFADGTAGGADGEAGALIGLALHAANPTTAIETASAMRNLGIASS
jgi:hypothetical protein